MISLGLMMFGVFIKAHDSKYVAFFTAYLITILKPLGDRIVNS